MDECTSLNYSSSQLFCLFGSLRLFSFMISWMILRKRLITPTAFLCTFDIAWKLKLNNCHNYVLPILNFLTIYEIKELLIKWLILDRPYSFYSSTGTSIRRSYLSEYNRSRCSPTRWAIPINRGIRQSGSVATRSRPR